MPKAQSGLAVKMNAGRAAIGLNANQLSWPVMAGEFSAPDLKVSSTIQEAKGPFNIEAEKGETIFQPEGFGGIPAHFKIGGKKHYDGGTKLNAPPDSFIFSDHSSMKIKDGDVQKMFGKTEKKSGYTPADIAKQYDINKYVKILRDPDSDRLQRETAEMMITNYNLKLGKLALAQESIKGFPQGIPAIAMPYMMTMNIDPNAFTQTQGQPEQPSPDNMSKGGSYVPKAQRGLFNRRKPTMRYNPQSGAYEVLDKDGNVIGFGNPGSQYPAAPTGYPPMGGMPLPPPGKSGTEASRVVKRQDIPKDGIIIKRADYKTEEEYIKARDNAYQTRGNKKVYTQGSDGKYYKVGEKAPTGTTPDENLSMLGKAFSDPAVQKALYDKTLAAAKNKENLGNSPGFDVKELEAMSAAQLTEQFLEMQNRNVKLSAHLKSEGIGFNCVDNKGDFVPGSDCKNDKYKTLEEAFKGAGVPAPADRKATGIQQISYIGYRDLMSDKNLDPTLAETLKPFAIEQGGVNDEKGPASDQRISKADGVYTNTTAGQVAGIRSAPSIIEELAEETEEKVTDPAAPAQYTAGNLSAPWWLQDIVNISGKFGDWARLRKRYPNLPVPEVVLPEGVFADPNRALAANAEQANIMAQNLAAFQGPQALSSRSSQIQGQAARQAADIMGRYDTMNVGVANQLESQRSQILNTANANRANIKSQEDMYNAIVDQNFQNAETAARNNLRQSYINAMNNRWTAFNVNQLTDQYQMHPEIGGGIFFDHGRPVQPDSSSSTSLSDAFITNRRSMPGVDDSVIWQITKNQMGVADDNGVDPNYQAMLEAQANMYNTSQGQ